MNDCFVWGRASSEGPVELQDAVTGYGTANADRVQAVGALLECGAQPAEYLAALAEGSTESQPHDWARVGDEERRRIAELVLAARSRPAKVPRIEGEAGPAL